MRMDLERYNKMKIKKDKKIEKKLKDLIEIYYTKDEKYFKSVAKSMIGQKATDVLLKILKEDQYKCLQKE